MTEQEWTDKPIPWKPPWAVIRDGESLGMLLHPDGRIFRIQQFGKDGMWGNADDNDEVCAELVQPIAADIHHAATALREQAERIAELEAQLATARADTKRWIESLEWADGLTTVVEEMRAQTKQGEPNGT